MNRVLSNNQPAKPSREVRVGDLLQIKNEGGDFQIEVLRVSEQRGPAAVAQTLYKETEASRLLRQKVAEERRLLGTTGEVYAPRPSKRDRRLIHSFRGRD